MGILGLFWFHIARVHLDSTGIQENGLEPGDETLLSLAEQTVLEDLYLGVLVPLPVHRFPSLLAVGEVAVTVAVLAPNLRLDAPLLRPALDGHHLILHVDEAHVLRMSDNAIRQQGLDDS